MHIHTHMPEHASMISNEIVSFLGKLIELDFLFHKNKLGSTKRITSFLSDIEGINKQEPESCRESSYRRVKNRTR